MIDDYAPGIDDQFDERDYGEPERCWNCDQYECVCGERDVCPGCGCSRCECHDDRCDECDLYGPMQCTAHGAAEIECARQYHEHFATIDALESLLAMPDAWHGPGWSRLRESASVVLTQMKRSNW